MRHEMDIVSITAGSYMQPLGLMIKKLTEKSREGVPGEANEFETSWALPSILLAVVMFEGWMVRVRYDLDDKAPTDKKTNNALGLYNHLRKHHPLPDVTEAFVAVTDRLNGSIP
jgi:hypothetical protein